MNLLASRLRTYLEFVRFSHTVFALPWALAAMMLAAREQRGWPGARVFLLILGCMVSARTAAMAFNRIADRHFDAQNPRTRTRHLPSGRITLPGAWALVCVSAFAFLLCAAFLNRLTLWLAPVALAVVFAYSFTKRFTDLSHFVLGLALGLSPAGAWIAVTGETAGAVWLLAAAVMLWVAGFDIIYATQDYEFDRQHGLRSLVVRFGPESALRLARILHAGMVGLLVAFGLISRLGRPYWAGLAVVAVCLAAEHWLARKRDTEQINRAFFHANALVSFVLLAGVAADVALG